MTRTVVDSMIRIPLTLLTEKQVRGIKRSLTLRTPGGDKFGFGESTTVEVFHQDEHTLSVPRNWPGARVFVPEADDRRAHGSPVELAFKGDYRTGQREFVARLVRGLSADGFGAIGVAECGFGKTVMGTALIAALKTTALVLVHRESPLADQWEKAVTTFLGVEPGFVRGDKCDFQGRQVVLAMISSVYCHDYPKEFFDYFGLVIVDEAHIAAAPTFSAAVARFPARWRVGLTATPTRGDRLEDVFFWHIGDVVATGVGDAVDCEVRQIIFDPQLPDAAYCVRGEFHLAKTVSKLSKHKKRTRMIVSLAVKAAQKGRNIFILSDRVAHLQEMRALLVERFAAEGLSCTAEVFAAGKTKKAAEQQARARLATVTLGTYTLIATGTDFPEKDVMILATPKANIQQAVGRIRRPLPDKRTPVVVDIVDDIVYLTQFSAKRERYYERPTASKGRWPIQTVRAR